MDENGFWKVCEALDGERRLDFQRHLLATETTEFLSVSELAEKLGTSEPATVIAPESEPAATLLELTLA